MERSVSAGSESNAHTTTSGSTHRRNASIKAGKRGPGPSTASLFLTNLRLLDLDLLPDWPHIDAASLSNQDARTRVRCTEYALYQLFKLYDPVITADKLQPFFPPLEPLQSVNLRAALFRCLNELKKNGVLPRETVLRKSMLDDCQGDRFWELSLGFSVIVLRKLGHGGKPKRPKPVAEKIASSNVLTSRQTVSMLPLAVAHKAALSQVLEKKCRKRETYARLYELLSEKGIELKQRKATSQQHATKSDGIQTERAASVELAVEKSWIGSTVLKDALIGGDTCAKGDGLLVESFEQLWQQDGHRGSVMSNGAEVGLLQDLSSRATQQSVRLSMWQNYLQRLFATKPIPSQGFTGASEVPATNFCFDKHRELGLQIASPEGSPKTAPTRTKHQSALQYGEILTSMREELRKNSTHRQTSNARSSAVQVLKRAQTQPIPTVQRKEDVDAFPGANDPHSRTPSQTTVPVRTGLGRRLSSQPKIYDKPKVEGQREPIPLKSELFSPLKENRRSMSTLAVSPSVLPSPAEERVRPMDVEITRAKHREGTNICMESPATNIEDDIESSESLNCTRTDTSISLVPRPEIDTKLSSSNANSKAPALPEISSSSAGAAARPSLAERTRMSIAFNSSDDIASFLPDVPSAGVMHSRTNGTETESVRYPPTDQNTSLLERTRESSSMMAPPQQTAKPKKSSHNRTRSSIYPVNQFDTPKKARSSTIGTKRDVTPIEQLLSPDVEYDSIFKARPRVAVSPKLSPHRDVSFNRHEPQELDVVGSSPLDNVNSRYR